LRPYGFRFFKLLFWLFFLHLFWFINNFTGFRSLQTLFSILDSCNLIHWLWNMSNFNLIWRVSGLLWLLLFLFLWFNLLLIQKFVFLLLNCFLFYLDYLLLVVFEPLSLGLFNALLFVQNFRWSYWLLKGLLLLISLLLRQSILRFSLKLIWLW
jgi:hypothetical protein